MVVSTLPLSDYDIRLKKVAEEYIADLKDTWPSIVVDIAQPSFRKMLKHLYPEDSSGIHPDICDLLNSLKRTPFEKVRVVIVGEGPYPNECANGVAFECPSTMRPSMLTIQSELERDIDGFVKMATGDLGKWTDQGVLMLNYYLTSNDKSTIKDTESCEFTKKVIRLLDKTKKNLVFMLWGEHACSLLPLIRKHYHCILMAPHPSPMSGSFHGCKIFSKCNEYLEKKKIQKINWIL